MMLSNICWKNAAEPWWLSYAILASDCKDTFSNTYEIFDSVLYTQVLTGTQKQICEKYTLIFLNIGGTDYNALLLYDFTPLNITGLWDKESKLSKELSINQDNCYSKTKSYFGNNSEDESFGGKHW